MNEPAISPADDQVMALVGIYLTKAGNKINPWFWRGMKKATIEVRDKVRLEIKRQGLKPRQDGEAAVQPSHPARSARPAKEAMREEDWDALFEKVFAGMFRHPAKSIAALANGYMAQVPEGKRKRISGLNIEPLITRIKARFDNLLAQEKELVQVRAELELVQEAVEIAPTKERVLEGLTSHELLSLRNRVLDLMSPHETLGRYSEDVILEEIPTPLLIGKAVQRALEDVETVGNGFLAALTDLRDEQKRKPAAAEPKRTNGHGHPAIAAPTVRLPKVALIGLKPNQFQVVAEGMAGRADCKYVERDDRTGETVPNNCSLYVIWARHAMHLTTEHVKAKCKQNGSEYILHFGGTDKLIQRLETVFK